MSQEEAKRVAFSGKPQKRGLLRQSEAHFRFQMKVQCCLLALDKCIFGISSTDMLI